ncbi:hypothetical protein ACFU99_38820 [Streptomyces sp. NPDC057654]|uniref:hypothetical protein n=1 Tax=Streptomyces sp. NPDC057654 TaxID=3346196 RepID=UPI00368FCCA6
MPEHINIISSNVECNGRGDARVRAAAHRAWAEADAHLVLQQELPGADADGKSVMYEADHRLAMNWVLGPASYTALFYDPKVFTCLREWEPGRRTWSAPPAAASLRLVGTGPTAMPLIGASAHLSYDSYAQREIEAGWTTGYADKTHMIDGIPHTMPALIGIDRNSYRTGDPNIPRLEEIPNLPHRAHRSRPGPDGTRIMDTVPDETLYLAGLIDVVGHLSADRDVSKLTTMAASASHSPATTVDAVYADHRLLPALVDAATIDMHGISDHDAVLTRWHRATLTDLLSDLSLWATPPARDTARRLRAAARRPGGTHPTHRAAPTGRCGEKRIPAPAPPARTCAHPDHGFLETPCTSPPYTRHRGGPPGRTSPRSCGTGSRTAPTPPARCFPPSALSAPCSTPANPPAVTPCTSSPTKGS